MAIGYGQPVPKPEQRKRTKARKDRADAKGLKAFRDAVWARGRICWHAGRELARCERCRHVVTRGDDGPMTGDVHHRIGRRDKAHRYDPSNGVLLCNHLVNDCHGKVQRHEVEL